MSKFAKSSAAVIAAAGMAAGVGVTLTPQAHAVTGAWVKPKSSYGADAYGTHHVGYATSIPVARGWMGSYSMKNASTGAVYDNFYCLDVTKDHPYKANYSSYTVMDGKHVYKTDFGTTLTAARKEQIGYLINRYGTTADKGTAAAVATVLYDLEGNPSYNVNNPNSNGYRRLAAHSSALVTKAKQIKANTLANYGTYKLTTTSNATSATKAGATITARAALSHQAATASVPQGTSVADLDDIPVTFTFKDTSTNRTYTVTAKTTNGVATANFKLPRSGAWTLTAATKALPANFVPVINPRSSGPQRLLSSDARAAASDAAPGFTVRAWAPQATTKTSSQVLSGPKALSDIISLTGGQPGASFTGTSKLYGPFAVQPAAGATAPAGAPVVGTATFSGTYGPTGTATVPSTALSVSKPGYYVWQESLNGVPAVSNPYRDRFGVASESSILYTPKLSTQVSAQQALPGQRITDTVTRSGFVNTFAGHAVHNVISGGLFQQDPGSPTWTQVATVPALEVNTNGTSGGWGPYVVPANAEEGTKYSYAETVNWWIDLNNNGVKNSGETGTYNHPVGQASQTTTVAYTATPELSTQASIQVATFVPVS